MIILYLVYTDMEGTAVIIKFYLVASVSKLELITNDVPSVLTLISNTKLFGWQFGLDIGEKL